MGLVLRILKLSSSTYIHGVVSNTVIMAEINKDFGLFIIRVLKRVHADEGMAGDSLATMNNLVNITVEKIMVEVNKLMQMTGKKTISSREIQSAVRLVFPGELAKHAVSEGTKAVVKYNATQTSGATSAHNKLGTSRSFRAGLNFPVTRTEKLMMSLTCAERKSDSAAVYLTAVIEYVVAEVLELAGNAARDMKRTRIIPRNIKIAISSDEELNKMFKDTLLSGGVLPDMLLGTKRSTADGEAPRKKSKKAVTGGKKAEAANPQKKPVKGKKSSAAPVKAGKKNTKGQRATKSKA